MTEHDRGAYMPQSDAPLAFDPRSPRDSRPMPMTLIASGGVLVLILGALFLAYRGGVRGAASEGGGVRQVGQPVGAIKIAAAPDAQPKDPDAGLDVYAAQNVPAAQATPAAARPPVFAAAPEQPKARPAPAAVEPARLQVNSVAPPPVRIEAPEAVTASATPRTTIRPGAADQKDAAAALAARPAEIAAAAPKPIAKPAAAKTVEAAPATTAAAKPAKPEVKPAPVLAKAAAKPETKTEAKPVETASTGGAAAVQIGAFSSQALASKGYADVSAMMAGRMGGHGSHVEPVAKDGKTMFRTTVTGFADRTAAKSFCAALSAKGHSCFVKAG